MHRQIRRWLQIALWLVPFVAFVAWACGMPIWPASIAEGGYGLLCSAAASITRLAQSAAAQTPAPRPAPSPAPAQPSPPAKPIPAPVQTVPGMPPVLNRANLYSAAGANMLSPAEAGALSRVYVPNLRSNDVYVIDPATRQVVDRFPSGFCRSMSCRRGTCKPFGSPITAGAAPTAA